MTDLCSLGFCGQRYRVSRLDFFPIWYKFIVHWHRWPASHQFVPMIHIWLWPGGKPSASHWKKRKIKIGINLGIVRNCSSYPFHFLAPSVENVSEVCSRHQQVFVHIRTRAKPTNVSQCSHRISHPQCWKEDRQREQASRGSIGGWVVTM